MERPPMVVEEHCRVKVSPQGTEKSLRERSEPEWGARKQNRVSSEQESENTTKRRGI